MKNNNYYEEYKDIVIDRKSDISNSNMTTIDITSVVKPNTHYKITSESLQEVNIKPSELKKIKNDKKIKIFHIDEIIHVKIKNNWNCDSNIKTSQSNILGDSGTLRIDSDDLKNNIELTIPIADISHLNFYNCELYKHNEIVSFDIDCNLPVSVVEIGHNYIDHYIMKKAGGVYLEFHNRPHYHMPLNKKAGGHLVIGKYHRDGILLSAFNIPYGYAIKMPNNVIHNDCFLTGDYLVIYSKTEEYSTVLLKNNKNKEVTVKIV